MKYPILLLILLIFQNAQSQSVGVNTNAPDPSAALDVVATDKGILIPRLTTSQRTMIANPAEGLLVFDTDTKDFWVFNGTSWAKSYKDYSGQDFALSNQTCPFGSIVTGVNSNGTLICTVDPDGDPSNEIQSLIKSGSVVSLTMGGGNFIDEVDDADADPSNEMQSLSLSGTDLSISGGNTVDLSGLSGGGGVFEIVANMVRSTGDYANDDFVFGENTLPVGGAGTLNSGKMFFFEKYNSAFRAGTISNSDNWNFNRLGGHSAAFGYNTRASNFGAFAAGEETQALGQGSVAFGSFSSADVNYTFAAGNNSTASGISSIAMGSLANASGGVAVSLGSSTNASGQFSFAQGNQSEAFGASSFASGFSSVATADYATAMGENTNAEGVSSFATGANTTAQGNYSFTGGYGSFAGGSYALSFGQQSFANSDHSVALGFETIANNQYAAAIGYLNRASGLATIALGYNTEAIGPGSITAGYFSEAAGLQSMAAGYNTRANGQNSFAMGYINSANGISSTAFGTQTIADGNHSFSIGEDTKAESSHSVAIGKFNVGGGDPSNWVGTDPLFEIGIGTDDLSRENALTVLKDGTVNLKNYALPLNDGNTNQILSTDGVGQLMWVDDADNDPNNELQSLSLSGTDLSISGSNTVDLSGIGGGAFEIVANTVRNTGDFANDDFVFGSQTLPPAGAISDTLFFYDSDKGAFRVGHIANNDFWSPDSIGEFSLSVGSRTLASGVGSVSFGENNRSVGDYSNSWGQSCRSFGSTSSAWGYASTALGISSTAWGFGSDANGSYSTAWGKGTDASGETSTTWGEFTNASGEYSTSWGSSTRASGIGSSAWGKNTDAVGDHSTSWGDLTDAQGEISTTWGNRSIATGLGSTAWGDRTTSSGDYSTALGIQTGARTYASFTLGRFNENMFGNASVWIDTDPLLEVGIGSGPTARENALTILKNGTISFKEYTFPLDDGTADQYLRTDGFGNLSWADELDGDPTNELQTISKSGNTITLSDGGGSFDDVGVFENNSGVVRNTGTNDDDFVFGMENLPVNGQGYTENLFFFDESLGAFRAGGLMNSTNWQTSSLGQFSIGMGEEPTASGDHSIALGLNASATETSSIAMGTNASATGIHGVAIGRANSANGDFSLALGEINTATGAHSTAIGWNTNAIGDFSTTMGQYINANAFNNFVLGRYNKGGGSSTTWVGTDPLFEIGNGSGFQGNESNAMTVLKNGKTGIGTHTPDEALSVVGTVRGAFEESETNFIEMGHGGNNAFINADGTGNIDIRHGDGNIMTLTPGKFVGIRTNSPDSDLHVLHSNSGASGGLRLENTSSGDHARLYVASSDGFLRIYSDDQAGAIGTFDDVTGAYSATSDRRLKENFEDLRFDWDTFMKLQALIYEYKVDKDNKKHIGMIAQDVEKIYPEMISYDADEDIYHMNYDAFGVIAIKAVQELKQENGELKALIAAKDEKTAKMESRLARLEALLLNDRNVSKTEDK